MSTYSGYMLIADISGYTAYLTSSEQDHANPILRALLSTLVEQIGEPLKLWRMEGDAVLAYSVDSGFPSGETFLEICENLYNSFATHRRNIIANTTCKCRACANVENLDLKIMAHHGQFEEIEVGPMRDISGADVILVHRMSKTDVKAVTGIHSYALFSDAAIKAMDIQSALTPYSQSFEHFGDVNMQVYDLAKAWQNFRNREQRYYLNEEDGVYTYRHVLTHPPHMVWQALVAPELKVQWMGLISVDVERPGGRIGPGSNYHCVHEAMEFGYWVTDWEPFDYFSTQMNSPMNEMISFHETYQVIPLENGTEVRYTMGPALDKDGVEHPNEAAAIISFLDPFWRATFATLDTTIEQYG